jgi:CO/xanthine dehydrogenase FAD-binding subunit
MARKCDRLMIAGSVAEAVAAKHEQPEARFIGGGTSMFADVGPAGEIRVSLISLRKVPELNEITPTSQGVEIGAGATAAELLHNKDIQHTSPLLAQAARALATRQVRNRATVGGNISTVRADHTLVPALLASEASVRVTTATGEQQIALSDYLQSMSAAQQSAGLVTAVSINKVSGFTGFTRVGPRNGPCYSIVSTAIAVDQTSRTVRLAIGNAHRTAFRATTAESVAEQGINWETTQPDPQLCAAFGAEAARECDPVTDVAASAEYRRHAVGVMARRLLEEALHAGLQGGRR